MTTSAERLLAEFVDRESEMARFCEMLDSREISVFAVWGGGGVGKSSLQAKMIHEVASRKLAKSEVLWSETRNHDLMAITRKIRDDFGLEAFSSFTDLVNFYTVPKHELTVNITGGGRIEVLSGAGITDSKVGDVAGIMIKDLMLTEPRSDMQVSESERRARLTDAFIEGMAKSLADRPAVVFFDATEKMTEEVEDWVWHELLTAACDGKMGQVKFVLCGRKEPKIGRIWRSSMEVTELEPLSEEHVIAYLERRGVEEAYREALADMMLPASKGSMLALATFVDDYLRRRKRRLRDEGGSG